MANDPVDEPPQTARSSCWWTTARRIRDDTDRTEQFSRQGYHIAYIIKEALARGATVVEPSQEAQDTWVKTIRQTAIDLTQFQRECTPGYFNNEGSQKMRWYLGESYGLGWDAFEGLLQEWRNNGTLNGLIVVTDE